jgi:hypothetical protein
MGETEAPPAAPVPPPSAEMAAVEAVEAIEAVEQEKPIDEVAAIVPTTGEYPKSADGNFEARVKWRDEDREYTDTCCGVFFCLGFVAFLALWIAMLASSNYVYKLDDGKKNGISDFYLDDARSCCSLPGVDPNSHVCGEMRSANPPQWGGSGGRRNGGEKPKPNNLFEGFELVPEATATIFLMVVVLSFLWLKCLEYCTTAVLLTPIAIQCSIGLFIAVWLFTEGQAPAGIIIFVIVIVVVGLCWWQRENIAKAAVTISVTLTAIFANPGLGVAIFCWLITEVLAVFMIASAAIALGGVSEVVKKTGGASNYGNQHTCEIQTQKWASGAYYFMVCMFYWLYYFLRAVQTYFIAGVLGCYHFHKDDAPPTPQALHFIKLACTKGLGTTAFVAGLTAFVEYLESRVARKSTWTWAVDCICCWWPITLILFMIYYCFKTTFEMITKVTLAYHVFSAKTFWNSAGDVFTLLKTRFGHAAVMQITMQNMFDFIGYLLSVGLGLVTWIWLGNEYDSCVLLKQGVDDNWVVLFQIIFLITYIVLLQSPWVALFLAILIGITSGNSMWAPAIPFMCGLFVGAIAAFFFDVVAYGVTCAVDAIFIAMAIQEECMPPEVFALKVESGEAPAYMAVLMEQVKADEEEFLKANPESAATPVAPGVETAAVPVQPQEAAPVPPPPAPGAPVPPPPPPPSSA